MSATSDFVKLRSKATPKPGQWNCNFKDAVSMAKKDGRFVVVCWSNGENCGYCVTAEKCMTDKVFQNWIKTKNAYFVFQYSGDSDKGKAAKDWVFGERKITQYPGFRVSKYDPKTGKLVSDQYITGNGLRGNKVKREGAKTMTANLDKMFAKCPDESDPAPAPEPVPEVDYKVRLNEKKTTAQVNKVLDALDKNDGYCPCQAGKTKDTKCHCTDLLKNKKIGEPCICGIFVKQKK